MLVRTMIQEVGVDMTTKRVLWVKARPDYEPLFSILDGMRQDADRRFWIERLEVQENNCDVEADTGQTSTGVKIAFPMSHNALTIVEEYVQGMGKMCNKYSQLGLLHTRNLNLG